MLNAYRHTLRLPFLYICVAVVMLFLVCSCEKADIKASDDNKDESVISTEDNVATFKITNIEDEEYTDTLFYTRSSDVQMPFSQLSIALFKDGKRVVYVHQDASTEGFGTYRMKAEEGVYTVVFIAHSGQDHANIYRPDSIRFAKNKLTDTFYYCSDVEVSAEDSVYSINLKRATAQVLISAPYGIDSNTAQMEFYYTGGSSTFDATTGLGCVASRQTETFDINTADVSSPQTFSIFTFPRAVSGELKLKVTPIDGNGTRGEEHVYENLKVVLGKVTKMQLAGVADEEQTAVRVPFVSDRTPLNFSSCY